MAIIGTFTVADNGYTGSVRTLTLNVRAKFVAISRRGQGRLVVLAPWSGGDVAGPNCVSVSTLKSAARCFNLAMMQRARKLVRMSQDDLSSFCLRAGLRLFATLAMVQGADRGCAGPVTRPDAVTSGCDSLGWI
jgi:hypothetical protein